MSRSSIIKNNVKSQVENEHVRKWVLKIEPQIINEAKSDDFWTGEISKNTLTDEMIWLIKLMDTEAGVCSMN